MTTQTLSKREQLTALLNEVSADEKSAVNELFTYLGGSEAQDFRDRMAKFKERTVPGASFDQVLGALLSVFDSIQQMGDKLNAQKIEKENA